MGASFITHWYLHVPSLLLAALIATVLARLVLTPVLGAANPLVWALAVATKPAVATVGAITPRIVPSAGVLVLTMIWLAVLRLGVLWVALVMGVRL
jgi:hypothetical protein